MVVPVQFLGRQDFNILHNSGVKATWVQDLAVLHRVAVLQDLHHKYKGLLIIIIIHNHHHMYVFDILMLVLLNYLELYSFRVVPILGGDPEIRVPLDLAIGALLGDLLCNSLITLAGLGVLRLNICSHKDHLEVRLHNTYHQVS
jgi:hypothetical protein